ncbi:MAG: PEP-utilizing enzyme [Bacteriovorax sp.]|jgi:phosphohistidine swiveling domain-containing protein
MKHWTRQESKERFPRPLTPLGWSLLHVPLEATLSKMSETLGVKKYARNEMIIWEDFYVYTRKDFFSDYKNLKYDYPRLLQLIFAVVSVFFQTLFKSFSEKGSFKGRFFNKFFYKVFGNDVARLINEWPERIAHLKNIMGRNFQLENITEMDFHNFVAIKNQMQEDSKLYFAEDFNVYFLKKLIFELLKSQLVEAGMDSKSAEIMLASESNGLAGNFSVMMIEDFNNRNLSIDELKKRYGHLTDNWDLYSPTMGETDTVWTSRDFSSNKSASAIKDAATGKIADLISWNPQANELIDWLQKLVLMDEDLRAYSSLQYPEARKLMSMVERSPAWKELVLIPDSIYFLHLNEIEYGLKTSNFHPYFDYIHDRRKKFFTALKTNPPFDLIEENGAFKALTPILKKDQAMKGSSVSAGKVEGIVTHINEYADLGKITKKSIIVLESATPVYAPFYALCGGIISEMGGQLSHGAIVAREYGIPMLTGVENICSILKEGQSILLDADNGVIKVKN